MKTNWTARRNRWANYNRAKAALRYHVTGAIERGEKQAIVSREARILDSGYQASAREEGHYDGGN